MQKLTFLVILVFLFSNYLFSQAEFDIQSYKDFLHNNKDMSYEELLEMYPAGEFKQTAITDFNSAQYSQLVKNNFNLTNEELELINKFGFMVSERVNDHNYIRAYTQLWQKDIPPYISSDAILHAWHSSFDNILIDIEKYSLVPILKESINALYSKLRLDKDLIPEENKGDQIYNLAKKDLDIYLNITKRLLEGTSVAAIYPENSERISDLMDAINKLEPKEVKLFSGTERKYDFSQLTPRGHYTQSPILEKYFKAMMWLGRTEFMITAPIENLPDEFLQKEEDIFR